MARLFEIDAETEQLYVDGMYDIITQFGKNCTLVFPPKITECPNCIYNPSTKKSSGRYKSGGPYPFANGAICPNCDGEGVHKTEQTEVVKMVIRWNPKDYRQYNINVSDPAALVKTRTFIEYLPNIERAEYILIDSDKDNLIRYKCKRVRESIRKGLITSRYVTTFWTRDG